MLKKKGAVTLSKQHFTTSSSALYHCTHGNWLFYHLKTAIVCADSPLRTENGGPLGAEVAHMQMMRLPTCRLNQHCFFFFYGGGWTLLCADCPYLPAATMFRIGWCGRSMPAFTEPYQSIIASKWSHVDIPVFLGGDQLLACKQKASHQNVNQRASGISV